MGIAQAARKVIFLEMFATSLGMPVSGALLNGVCYGFYFVIVPTYSTEVVPHHLRNITVAFTNMCLIAGQLLGQGVTSATQGRLELAETSLRRLAISKDPEELSNVIAMMEKTNRLWREYCETTSYLDCFKGTNLRRTEIATVPFTIQIISCNIFLASSTFFLSLAGLASSEAFYMGLGSYALAFCGNLACYPLMNFVGRRKVFLFGSLTNGFLYGGFALIGAIWAYFRLPELKGRTYEEMDILFEQRIPAKDFAKTVVHIGTLEEEKHQAGH
ncbi:hypothetical protein CC79DRAFT_1371000 [Sarocladium strictum]